MGGRLTMSRVRKVIFWCHLTTGVLAGVVILTMSVTGVLLTYERQIEAWADARTYTVAAAPDAARLPVETLVAKAREGREGVPTSVTLRADRSAAAAVGFPGGRTVFVDPYTGAVLGGGAEGTRAFFHVVTDVHRWLGASGENRTVGRAVTGACNLGFLFLVASGFYIWWPRKWTRPQFRSVLWFRRGLSAKARDFNWHNTIGFWSVAPLFLVVLSGVVISYQWAGNLVYRAAGEQPPAPRSGPPPGQQPAGEVSTAGLEPLIARAEQQVAGWRAIGVQLPATDDAPVAFSIDEGTGGQPQYRAQLTLDRATGEVTKWEPFSSFSTGRQLRSFLRFAHTGEVFGIPGQTIAGLVSLGGAVLVWTGLALSWRRWRAWMARRPGRVRAVAAAESPAD
jgi:uncharacterized iron-regulated membrane protein